MSRTSENSFISNLFDGVATIVADSKLTLINANDAFCIGFGISADAISREKYALTDLLDDDSSSRLCESISSSPVSSQCNRVLLRKEENRRPFHVTAVRVEEPLHENRFAVYQLVFSDQTEILELKQLIAFEKQKLDILTGLSEDISFEYDFATDTVWFADKYKTVFGSNPVIERFRERLSGNEFIDSLTNVFRNQFIDMLSSSGETSQSRVDTVSNEYKWFSLYCMQINGEKGEPVKALGIIRDIDRQKKEQLQLFDKSRVDSMTGLLNKSTTEESVKTAIATATSDSIGVLMMIDIDLFKNVNDTLGHLAGDEVIMQIARQLRRTFRENDFIGRVGGDEFIVYMQDVKDTVFVYEKAKALCESVEQMFENHQQNYTITISIGISNTEQANTYNELYRQADVALYNAKANGRNQSVFYGQELNSEDTPVRNAASMTIGATREGILVDIIDILFSTPDIRQGIEKVLEFIGNAFNIGKIRVVEKSLDLTTLSVTHEWAAHKEWLNKELYQNFSPDEIHLPVAQDANGIYYCSDTTLLTQQEKAFFKGDPVISHLQCNIVQDGKIIGYISFEERNRKRIWTQQEIDALILMSKLIGESIRQQQSLSLLHHSYSSTRSILNGIHGIYIYVVDENRNILYYNDNAARSYPDLKPGTKCFKVFKNRLHPCETCPEKILKEKGQFSTVLFDTPFGPCMNVSASRVLWENREWAYIVLFSEHTASPEEQEQQRKKATYIAALCNTCDHIVDIDLNADSYEILANSEKFNNYEMPEMRDYQQSLEFICENHIKASHRPVFLEKFSLPEMKKAFAEGVGNISLEYELLSEKSDVPVWKERTAFLHKLEDGSEHILFYVWDITEKKLEEARRKEEENNFILALQSNYSEIFHINLDKGLISPLYYNSDQIPIADSMNYMDYVHQRGMNRLHPDYVQKTFDFYELDRVRKLCAAGEASELEYLKRQVEGGGYQWVVAIIRPVEGNGQKALLLLRDVTDLKQMEKTVRGLEMRYNALFRLSYDISTEVNLETAQYSRTFFLLEKTDSFEEGKYDEDFTRFLDLVHPDDRQAVNESRSIDALRRLYRNGEGDNLCQYRILFNDEYIWMFSRVLFLKEDDVVTAFVLARNITAQKKIEEERNIETQRFNLAIRNTYNEIYEVDLVNNTCKLTYSNSQNLMSLPEEDSLDKFADRFVHPDDRPFFKNSIVGDNLSKEFASGKNEIHGDYRRLGYDGQWYWVSAIIVPEYNSYDSFPRRGLCFIRDISEKKKQEQQLRINEQYDHALRQIYDELYEINVVTDSYRIVYHVEGKYKTPAISGELTSAVNNIARDMIHPEDANRFLEFFDIDNMRRSFSEGLDYRIAEFRKLLQDGSWRWASLTVFPLSGDVGSDEMYLVFIMDIDARKQAEEIALQNAFLEKQRFADERYKTIVEQTNTLVFEWVVDTNERYISQEIPKRFAGNYDDRDIMWIWRDDHVIHPDDMILFEQFLKGIRKQNHVEMVARYKKRDGSYAWNRVTLSCLYAQDGKPHRYIGTINDVDNATRSVQTLKYRAEYDVLTGIYNMQAFYDRASSMMRNNPERQYYIVRLDIDRFKVINDLYGLEEGDRLLKTIAGLLSDRMKENAAYGRISGDIFCACVAYSREEIIHFVQDVAARLAEYPLASKIIPSFGICKVDNVQTPINVLCDWANLALKTVKGSFYPIYAFYDETLRHQILSEKKIESEMDLALLRKEFLMYLQPKVDIATSKIIGAEGLVRWNHPEEGLIPPDRFVPLFEKNGFIIQMDEYIWEQACICLKRWVDMGLEPVPVSVNVSRMHIHDNKLNEKLLELIRKYDLPPELLELELTESIFFENEELLVGTIRKLQQDGFSISLDDFGAGYSSLNMLKDLSIETIKLDRGFFNEVIVTPRGKTVVAHTISLAKALNINIIAEGVENQEQAEFLLNAGCPFAQGYYYSMPVPIGKFEELAFRQQYVLH
ncbi:diguanylate cyclase domain-containing protein [Oxalobacter formigenes]|uniref:diguanylate cyclase domain-containing protein n=1 Tax=Oxalobacter formigenes TaxID=847 RepID=UPI002FCD94FE